jgi:hypothetical protein
VQPAARSAPHRSHITEGSVERARATDRRPRPQRGVRASSRSTRPPGPT